MKPPLKLYPPSAMQLGMLYEAEIHGRGEYIQQFVVTAGEEKWDAMKVRECWEILAANIEALRIGVVMEPTGPAICFHPKIEPLIEIKRTPQESLEAFLKNDRARGIPLDAVPFWRVTMVEHEKGESVVWTFHHIMLDGRSHTKIFSTFWQMMDSATLIPQLHDASFGSYLEWLAAEPLEAADTFFQECLKEVRHSPKLTSGASFVKLNSPIRECLGTEDTAFLEAGAERLGVTLHTLVQAAWGLVLARHGETNQPVFGSVRAGRHWQNQPHPDALGCFIYTVPFLVNINDSQPIGEWLTDIREQQTALRAFEHLPLQQIQKKHLLAGALFQTILMFDSVSWKEHFRTLNKAWAYRKISLHEKTHEVTLSILAGKQLDILLDYPPEEYSPSEMRWILAHFCVVLRTLASANPADLVGNISLMSPGESALLAALNASSDVIPEGKVQNVIDSHATTHPTTVALQLGDWRMTYGELASETRFLAWWLSHHYHLLPGDRVLVFVDREPALALMMLSLFKLGAVFVPLDPATPEERILFCLKDSGAVLVVTTENLQKGFPSSSIPVTTIEELQRVMEGSGETLPPHPETDDAYILYTSGSTGTPKGVMTGHRGLMNFAEAQKRIFQTTDVDRIAQLSSPSFDACIFDVMMALYAGATLVFGAWEELHSGESLAVFLKKKRITLALLTPTLLKMLPEEELPELRVLICGGEVCPASLVEKWATGRRFINAYGPTETTIWSNYEEVHLPINGHPTIGRVLPNLHAYILDDKNKYLPFGIPGELCIGGVGVGLGYLNLPELTASRFPANPFAPSTRMYRTGDKARYLPDGRMDFIERFDRQVKIEGIRIELGEIEAQLQKCQGVREVAVLYSEEDFVAFIAPPVDPELLKQECARTLNFYLIPKHFVMLETLPQTITGKLDRQALKKERSNVAPPSVKLLAESAFAQVLVEWNEKTVDAADTVCVPTHISTWAKHTPDALAVEGKDGNLTYEALETRSNQIAHLLLQQKDQDPVVVFVELNSQVPAILAGVMKAGKSYIPLDPSMPENRIAYILEQSGAAAVITQPHLAHRLPQIPLPLHILDPEWKILASHSESLPDVELHPNDLAYIIYTSGSTGHPKGVEIEHHSLANLCRHYQKQLVITPADRSSLLASISFDASIADLWPYLTSGASVHVPPSGSKADLRLLADWLVAEKITRCFAPTALGELLFDFPWSPDTALQDLLIGGDRLTRYPTALPFRVWNTYGPTECTVDAIWYEVPHTGAKTPPPIGHPILNYSAYVVNEEHQPVAIGEMGALLLGGAGVARGYRNQAELTNERFIPNPFASGRLYCTGDLVRYRSDGTLEFIGRADNQVQIHGFRVELGEIEAAIRSFEEIREVHVCMAEVARKQHIVAYYATAAFLPKETLKQQLALSLPPYMIPAVFVPMQTLPRNTAGKVDAERLPAPVQMRETTPNDGAKTKTEQAILTIAEDVLGVSPLGVTENFFDAGGDSILLLTLLLRIEKAFSRSISAMSFLQNPCIQHLATLLDNDVDLLKSCILPIKPDGSKTPFFCLCPASWFRPIALQIDKNRPLYALEILMLDSSILDQPTIETIAQGLLVALRKFQPTGPYLLGAYSSNGMAVIEMARILLEQGETLPLIILFDVHAPSLMRTTWLSRTFWKTIHLLARPKKILPRLLQKKLPAVPANDSAEVLEELKKYQQFARKLHLASLQYKPKPVDTEFVIIKPTILASDLPNRRDLGWHSFCKKFTVYELAGDHRSFLENDEELARIIEKYLSDSLD